MWAAICWGGALRDKTKTAARETILSELLPSWQPQFQNVTGFGLLESIRYPAGYIRQSLHIVYLTNSSPLVSVYLYALDSGTEITSQIVSVKIETIARYQMQYIANWILRKIY